MSISLTLGSRVRISLFTTVGLTDRKLPSNPRDKEEPLIPVLKYMRIARLQMGNPIVRSQAKAKFVPIVLPNTVSTEEFVGNEIRVLLTRSFQGLPPNDPA